MNDFSTFTFPASQSPSPTEDLPLENPPMAAKPNRMTSKAHRLLGQTSPLFTDYPRRKPKANNKMPDEDDDDLTFMRISVAEIGSDQDAESPRAVGSPLEPISRATLDERSRRGSCASSNVLSPELLDPAASSTGAETSVPRRMPSSESISTLKSFYDRKRSPLAVSQQTSASSARDMALRKGCPTISETQADSSTSSRPSTAVPGTVGNANGEEEEQSKKKRPRQLDFSKLFPKPRPTNTEMLSPSRLTHSPSSLSLNSDLSQSTLGKERRGFFGSKSGRKLQKPAPAPPAKPANKQPTPSPPSHSTPNAKASKVLGKPPLEPKEWFDMKTGFEDSDEEEAEPSTDERPSVDPPTSVPPRKFSHDSMDRAPTSARSLNFPSSANLHPLYSPPGIPVSPHMADRKSVYSVSSRCTAASRKTSASAFVDADLRNQSVLSLSSSDGDDFSDDDTSISGAMSEGKKSPKPATPNTVGLAVSSSHRVSVGSQSSFGSRRKQLVRPKTAPEESVLARSHSSTSRHQAPPLPKMPSYEHYQMASPRAVSRSSRQSLGDRARPPSTLASPNQHHIEQPELLRSPRRRSADVEVEPVRGAHRIMTVTEEEEGLLHATRAQRMRPTLISPGKSKFSWSVEDDGISPLTSPHSPRGSSGNAFAQHAELRAPARASAGNAFAQHTERRAEMAAFNFDESDSPHSSSQSQSDSSDLVTDQDLDDLTSFMPRSGAGVGQNKGRDSHITSRVDNNHIDTFHTAIPPRSYPRGPLPAPPPGAAAGAAAGAARKIASGTVDYQAPSSNFGARTHPRYQTLAPMPMPTPMKHAPLNSFRVPDRRTSLVRGPVY